MDQDSVHMVLASKVPMLKPGDYELWRMRMEQYIQMVDYSLWEVIENGNAPPVTKVVEGVETVIAPTTFNSIKDAKSLLQAIEKRLEGNAATKKTQRNLLKQQYEDFTASSLESNTTAKLPILKLAQDNSTSVTKMLVPVTAEEKTNKKNDVKARSLLLMALPNEHQLTFSQYTDAKTMFAAIET
ncbi:hypothetical protein Tco_0581105 [Tanacetum coccineum]